jgi:hypothetical protein
MRGRRFALADGDQASVEALQYNRAVLAVTCLRAEHFEDQAGAEAVVAARREINSARNFQSLTKNEAGPNHLQLCEARLSSIEGKHDLALAGLEATVLSVPFARGHFNESSVCLELAYCQFKLMQFDLALSSVSRVDFNSLVELEIDDRFVASCMLLEMSASDPRFGSPELLASQHHELREAYLKSRSDLSALVKKFCDESLGPLEAV